MKTLEVTVNINILWTIKSPKTEVCEFLDHSTEIEAAGKSISHAQGRRSFDSKNSKSHLV